MRRSTAYNQRADRQRLSFATCRKCKAVVAVLGMTGQDIGHILYENGFRLPSAITLEIDMECVSCYTFLLCPAITVADITGAIAQAVKEADRELADWTTPWRRGKSE